MKLDRLWPVNVAEAMVDNFFDPHLSSLPMHHQTDLAGSGAQARQYWCNVKLDFPAGSSGSQLRLSRDCDIDVSTFDRFTVRASLPRSIWWDVDVVIDGGLRRVVDGEPGIDDFREYEGEIEGTRLTRIALTLSRADKTVTVANIEWTMVASSQRRAWLECEWPSYAPQWECILHPLADVDPTAIQPDIGIFFGAAEVEAIRKKAASPAYRRIYRQITDLAEEHRHD